MDGSNASASSTPLKHPFLHGDWQDDMKMTVMFSPFRDKNLNPKSWDQKVKFWSELIEEDCKLSGVAFIDIQQLREKYRRKGKTPSCLQTVFQEMIRKGQIKNLSDVKQEGSASWMSWGYSSFVKKPVGWGMNWLSGQQANAQSTDTYVVIDVIKHKAVQLVEIRSRLPQHDATNLMEYSDLRDKHKDLCQSDEEFDLVMKELVDTHQVVIQQDGDKSKFVKFLQAETNAKHIDEQDLHIHRIQKAHDKLKHKIELLSVEVKRLGSEAVSYRQKGINKLAMSCMRKRKLAQTRIDKLTGSMDTLDDILHRIHDAESNEMVLKAIEGGTHVLQGLNTKTTMDEVNSVMDNLADVTQSQDEIMAELNTTTVIDEPSQSELEDELSIILQEDTPPTSRPLPPDLDDEELQRELDSILNDSCDRDDMTGLNKMLDDLQLPDVPKSSPSQDSRKANKLDMQPLTS